MITVYTVAKSLYPLHVKFQKQRFQLPHVRNNKEHL